jgi:PAS domain S-box-containing protein
MGWQLTPYLLGLLVAATASLLAGLGLWRTRRNPRSRTGAVLLLASAVWMTGNALELASIDLPVKIFWDKVQFVGICVIPTAWLVYMLRFTSRDGWVTRRNLVLLGIVPMITLVLAATNEAHSLIWSGCALDTSGHTAIKVDIYGPWLWLFIAYSYIEIASGLLLLVQALVHSGQLYRWQASGLSLAVLAVWIVSIVSEVVGWRPIPDIDLTPVALAVTVPVLAWGFYRLRQRDIMPVAWEAIVESMQDRVVVVDGQNRILDMNPAAQQLVGRSLSEVIGEPVEQMWAEWPGVDTQISSGVATGREVTLGDGDEQRIYDVRSSPLTDWRGRSVSWVVVLRDITERVEAERQVAASLKEKEVLLQEIHHRVKNNLQIISSLLNLQAQQLENQQILEAFRDSQNRIRSMALIHEQLYGSHDLAGIDFGAYIQDLLTFLFRSYQADSRQIRLDVETDKVSLAIDQAVPCGLIVNELVSNALKHAFPDGRQGGIRVVLGADEGLLALAVSDDGIGLPEGFDHRTSTSLGLQLVNSLVSQLDGEIMLEPGQGTGFKVTFPVSPWD